MTGRERVFGGTEETAACARERTMFALFARSHGDQKLSETQFARSGQIF
jgi:hypothetical protein